MKNILLTLVMLCATINICNGDDADIAESLQDCSVTVLAPGLVGSGTIISNGYVLTCAHVVSHADISGTTLSVNVYQDTYRDGEFKFRRKSLAWVYKYSVDNDTGLDIAILKLDQPQLFPKHILFNKRKSARVGDRVILCGTPLGTTNHNSVTRGIVSFTGRFINNRIHDQTDATMFEGNSGCGVFTESGEYLGMLSRGQSSGIGYYLPNRVILKFLQSNNIKVD